MYETVFTSGLGCGKYNRCLGCQKTAKSRLEGSSGLKYTSPPQIILGNTNLQKSNLSGDLLVAPGATLQLCILTQYWGGSSRQKTLSLTSTVICNPVYTPNSRLVWKVRGAERRHAERGYVGTQDGVCGHGNRRLLTSGVSAVAVHVHGGCVCVCVCVLTARVSVVLWVAVTFQGQLLALNMPQSWASGKSRKKTLMFAAKAPG